MGNTLPYPFQYKKTEGWWYVDHRKLAILLIPTFLRKEPLVSWLYTLVFPLVKMNKAFDYNRRDNFYKLEHNGQVCYLRKALNDRFDIRNRQIIITDGSRYERIYIFTHAEQQPPNYIYTHEEVENGEVPMYLHPATDYADTGVDFKVLVPEGLNYNENEMRALVDFYRIAGKRYTIETYIP